MEEVGRGGKHGKTLRCCSSSSAGKGGTGAAALGGMLAVKVLGKYC